MFIPLVNGLTRIYGHVEVIGSYHGEIMMRNSYKQMNPKFVSQFVDGTIKVIETKVQELNQRPLFVIGHRAIVAYPEKNIVCSSTTHTSVRNKFGKEGIALEDITDRMYTRTKRTLLLMDDYMHHRTPSEIQEMLQDIVRCFPKEPLRDYKIDTQNWEIKYKNKGSMITQRFGDIINLEI